jgi:hypothetical protein
MADYSIAEFTEGGTVYGIMIQSIAKALRGNGVALDTVAGTALKATERGAGANMSVDVATGSCIINGTKYTEASIVNLVVSAAHASLDRYDLIVYDQSAGNPAIVAGTAAATPNPPDVADDNDIPLAIVFVEHAATSIVNSDIFDMRCGATTGGRTTSLVGKIPLTVCKQNDDANIGSGTSNGTTSYVVAGISKITSDEFPAVIAGTSIVAKFVATLRSNNASGTTTVELYDNTDAESITTVTSTSTTAEIKVSGSLTYGTSNQIVTAHEYRVRVKTSNAAYVSWVYEAAIEFYAEA